MFTFQCPKCTHSKQTDEANAGKNAKCNRCGHSFVIPSRASRIDMIEISLDGLEDAEPASRVVESGEPATARKETPRFRALNREEGPAGASNRAATNHTASSHAVLNPAMLDPEVSDLAASASDVPLPDSVPPTGAKPRYSALRGVYLSIRPHLGTAAIVLLLTAGVVVQTIAWRNPKEAPPKWFYVPNWEYKIESPHDVSLESQLKFSGDYGWELITARRATSEDGPPKYEMIFKRPIKGEWRRVEN